MSEPRNVTPDVAWPEGTPPTDSEASESATATAKPQAEWWTGGWDGRQRGFPILGVLLVIIGLGLLVQWFFPAVGAGTLILMALGTAFLGAWLTGRSWFAMVPGFLLLALGIANLIEDLSLLLPEQKDVPGLTSTALAIGFLAIFVIARLGNRRWLWPLWAAAIFGIIGGAQLSQLVTLPEFGAVVPVLIIALGIIVLFNWRRERA